MKRVMKFLMCGVMVLSAVAASAQSDSDSRMNRDVAVAENVLSTLIKQEFSKRNFFPIEVNGNYRVGYGVTFTVPTDMLIPMVWGGENEVVVYDGVPGAYSYSFSTTPDDIAVLERQKESAEKDKVKAEQSKEKAEKLKERAEVEKTKAEIAEAKSPRADGPYKTTVGRGVRSKSMNRDSLAAAYTTRIIEASKNFLADYGDMMSLLKPEEKIVITNRGENNYNYYWNQNDKRTIMIVEATKGDLTSFRQGKITREQLLAKIKVTNTESSGKREPDLEVLSSAFNRLYDSDLSTTFFVQGSTYYERLNDFGAILYMQVFSSNQARDGLLNMPTVNLREVDQETRDKKVKELYPVFEKELKENILEYGSLIRSLKDNEFVVFNVKLTKCKSCGIPTDIEITTPISVLRDYSAGKLDKNSAIGKMTVKKGAGQ
jgi:hypothetical protein